MKFQDDTILPMRITLSNAEAEILINTLVSIQNDNLIIMSISERIKSEMLKPISIKKVNATKKATETRTKKAKYKITNALNLMRLEGKKININSVAIEAEVSYNTAKKYKDIILS